MTVLNVVELNEEVLFTRTPLTSVKIQDIAMLKNKAMGNRRRRVRLCAHPNEEDLLHEMLIVHMKDTYVPPHKHLKKIESFHIIEGRLKIVSFDDSGRVTSVITMGDYASGDTFFFRNSESCYHTVIPLSNIVVFHETTNGPFCREDTVFAPWAPGEDQLQEQELFTKELNLTLAAEWQ